MRLFLFLIFALPLALPAQAGQLRDYSLPSETRTGPGPILYSNPPMMQVPNVQQMPIQQQPMPPPRLPDDGATGRKGTEGWDRVMSDFRNQALSLDLPQRRALADTLKEKIKKSVDGGDTDRAKYYMGLLREVESLIPTGAPAGGAQ